MESASLTGGDGSIKARPPWTLVPPRSLWNPVGHQQGRPPTGSAPRGLAVEPTAARKRVSDSAVGGLSVEVAGGINGSPLPPWDAGALPEKLGGAWITSRRSGTGSTTTAAG